MNSKYVNENGSESEMAAHSEIQWFRNGWFHWFFYYHFVRTAFDANPDRSKGDVIGDVATLISDKN